MGKLIFLLNTSWQWGLIVGIVWLLVYQFRRAHAICYALWLMALVMLPILLGLNALLPGISFHRTQIIQVVSASQLQPTDTSNHQSSVSGQVITGNQLSPQVTNPLSRPQTKSSRITWQHILGPRLDNRYCLVYPSTLPQRMATQTTPSVGTSCQYATATTA